MATIDTHPIPVEQPQHWDRLKQAGLTTVVDPMVWRAGEIFLRGRKGDAQQGQPLEADPEWQFLDKNLLSLGFFFDALILNERLPVFNYGDSFDMQLNFAQRSFAAIDEAAETSVLVPVQVGFGAYQEIKSKAIGELEQRLNADGPAATGAWVPAETARAIVDEFAQSAYHWEVSLGWTLEQRLPSELDRQIGRFLIGGMIFGHYADRLKSEHWIQPKRARLWVSATTGGTAPTTEDERALFDWIGQQYGLPTLRTWQPTFLHHVLDKARTRADVPRVIAQLRRSGAVRDYREWRRQALAEWHRSGGLSEDSARTIERLKQAITKETGGMAAARDAGVALVESAVSPGPVSAAKAAAKTAPLLGWVLDQVPGRRHVKLLADSLHARGRYPQIERAVKSLWQA